MFKGVGYHSIAKIAVVLAAYVLHFLLGKMLSLAEYGVVGTIISFCNFYYMFLTNGARQAISKSISSEKYNAGEVLKKGFVFQIIFGIALSLLNFVLAPIFAEQFGDPSLTGYFRQLSLLILATGVYFALTGGLNGAKLFLAEAIVTIVYPILRLSSVPLAYVFKSDKPSGVIWGFTLASVLSALLTCFFLRRSDVLTKKRENAQTLTYKKIAKSSIEFISFFAAITLVLNMDTFFLQYVRKDMELTGLYTGVHTFSLVPYYLVSAFYLVILPYVSEKWTLGDKAGVAELVKKNCNILYMLILPVVVLISLTAKPLLVSFYDSGYESAGSALSLLCFGTFLLSFYAMLSVVLNGIGKKKFSIILSAIVLLIDIPLLYFLIPHLKLIGAALATTISAFVGCSASYIELRRNLGGLSSPKILAKMAGVIAVCAVACIIGMKLFTFTNLVQIMLFYIVLGIIFVFCFAAFKVVDINPLVKKILKK